MIEISRRGLLLNASSALGTALILPSLSDLRLQNALSIAVQNAVRPYPRLFVAEATPLVLLVELLTAGAAIATIAQFLGFHFRWSQQPSSTEASQCKPNFEKFLADQRRQGDQVHTDVQRSPVVRDIAAQGTQQNAYATPALSKDSSVAVQYRTRPAVALRGRNQR